MAGEPLFGVSKRTMCVGLLHKLKGDLDWWAEDWGLPRHNVNRPCACCPARRHCTDMPVFHLQRDAEWVANVYTNAMYEYLFPDRHPIFNCQPGVGILVLSPDYMHDKHLGFDTYFLASVLVVLVYEIMPESAEDNLVTLWGTIEAYYKSAAGKSHSSDSYSNMKLSMFGGLDPENTAPKMKGRAAEINALTPALLHAFRIHMNPADATQKQIRLALKLSARMDAILRENRNTDALPHEAAVEFENSTWDLCAVYTLLNNSCRAYGYHDLFNITIKTHYLCHIALNARFLNPRSGWCYGGEDLMHKLKVLAATCCKAHNIYNVFSKMNEKYLLALHQEYKKKVILRRR